MVEISAGAARPEQAALALPPGFRFHPTDEEVITSYLLEKLRNPSFTCRAVGEVDLNKCEPWDLPSKAKMGEKEWYFFCHKGMKYPTGVRANRATKEGYWKATGKDREIFASKPAPAGGALVGMRKTLVFYMGRAPRGSKTNWVMHEFRLEGKSRHNSNLRVNPKDEWVVCKVFHKGEAKTKASAAASADAVMENPVSAVTTPNVSSVDAGEGADDDLLDYYSMLDAIDVFTSSASSLPLPLPLPDDKATVHGAAPYNSGGYSIPTGSFPLPNYSLTNARNQQFAMANVSLHQGGDRQAQASMAKALGGAIGSNSGVLRGLARQNYLGAHPGYYNSHLTTGPSASAGKPASMENLGANAW